MKIEYVDDFKELHCSVCKKDLENEKQIVVSEQIFGKYLCLNCHYDRSKIHSGF